MRLPPRKTAQVLLGDWALWLSHNAGLSDRTVSKYVAYIDRLLTWCRTPPADEGMRASTTDALALTPIDLERFCGMYAHSIGIRPRSRRPLVAAVRGFYAWLASASGGQAVADSPAAAVPYPRAGKPLPRAVSLLHAERLLMTPGIDTFQGLRDTAMIATLVGCGLRVSGLVAMNESSLIWARDHDGTEVLSVRVTEKGKKDRIVPAPAETMLLIRAYLGHVELAGIERTLGDGDRVLWVTQRNHLVPAHDYHGGRRRITARAIAKLLDRYAAKAGIPAGERHPHAMRHLYGTEMAESDTQTLTQQALMGHASPVDTEIYARLAQRKLRTAVDKGNPLGKMRSPLLDSLREIQRAATKANARSFRPSGSYNRDTPDHASGDS